MNKIKEFGIQFNKIDNGYMVAPTYQYKKYNNTIEIDKDDDFGTSCYVMTVNGLILKAAGKIMKWHSLKDAQADMIELFTGYQPTKHYTTCY